MINGELKNKIDKLWLEFWQGGIANPLTTGLLTARITNQKAFAGEL